MEIRKNDRTVFFGDSITEWGRDKADPASLGTGFVSLVAADLLDRVDTDCLSLNPDVVILMVMIIS